MTKLALIVASALALLAPATADALVVGIADQKPDMFTDTRFERLNIRHARIAVAWDVMNYSWQVKELDRWMLDAREAGVHPLVSFGHSTLHRRLLPTPERFRREFRRFRARYPWARNFASWNEANHCGEPTCHREALVAAYWRKLNQECRSCKILAAELLDMPNLVRWVKRFRRHAGREPAAWGLHNYVEANRFQSDRLRSLLRNTKGSVWLTEVGGIVKRRIRKRYTVKRIPESAAHAAKVMRFLFDDVVALNPRITRVYLYHWNAETTFDSWDSALVGPTGQRRPAFDILRQRLRQLRREDRNTRVAQSLKQPE
jgi:hypothetical protein